MKTNKEYRFKDNPIEQEFHDKFKKMFERDGMSRKTLSAIIFGWENDRQNYPKEYLTAREEDICCNLIQWLGSPVGQGFLDSCGFVRKDGVINKDVFISVSEQEPPHDDIELLAKSPTGTIHLCHWRPSYGIFTCQAKSDSTKGWEWKLI